MAVRRVLVVDDEDLIRWSLVERLRSDGHQVVEAATAAEALEKAQMGVDLVLLDYKLPDEDGLTVLRKIREIDPDTLVIMLTAHKGVETVVVAMKAGAFDYATKPFDLEDVAVRVSHALETTRLRRELRDAQETVWLAVRPRSRSSANPPRCSVSRRSCGGSRRARARPCC